jgi:hypothetical protein
VEREDGEGGWGERVEREDEGREGGELVRACGAGLYVGYFSLSLSLFPLPSLPPPYHHTLIPSHIIPSHHNTITPHTLCDTSFLLTKFTACCMR